MELKKATINDLSELQRICADLYTEIFADHWNENGLELYLEREFGTGDAINSSSLLLV